MNGQEKLNPRYARICPLQGKPQALARGRAQSKEDFIAKKRNSGSALVPAAQDLWPGKGLSHFFSMPLPSWSIGSGFSDRLPDVDMVDGGSRIRIRADLPGIEKKDIKVTVERASVTITARTYPEKKEKGRNFYYRERSSSGYYRSIPLPAEVDAKSARARAENGTLAITLNKKGQGRSEIRVE